MRAQHNAERDDWCVPQVVVGVQERKLIPLRPRDDEDGVHKVVRLQRRGTNKQTPQRGEEGGTLLAVGCEDAALPGTLEMRESR